MSNTGLQRKLQSCGRIFVETLSDVRDSGLDPGKSQKSTTTFSNLCLVVTWAGNSKSKARGEYP
jgi:hypothetical protein